jgi:carbohydrate-selective porin OprB
MTSTRPSPRFHRARSFALTACVCLVLVMVASGAPAAEDARDAAPAADAHGVSVFESTAGGISGNPGATNFLTGTGLLGRLLGFGKDSGVRLGGLWIGDANFGLVPGRRKDSIGAGIAVSWLDENLGFRSREVMLAAYYQAHAWSDIYVQPTVTHVPNPGRSRSPSPATAITLRATVLF